MNSVKLSALLATKRGQSVSVRPAGRGRGGPRRPRQVAAARWEAAAAPGTLVLSAATPGSVVNVHTVLRL